MATIDRIGAAAFLMIAPSLWADLLGIVIIVISLIRRKKNPQQPIAPQIKVSINTEVNP